MNENNNMQLPAGYTERPALISDAKQVSDLLNICVKEHNGKSEWDEIKLSNDWSSPHFDINEDTRIVMAPNGDLAGYVDIWDESPHVQMMCLAAVHPAHRQKGIGAELVRWSEWRSSKSVPKAPEDAQVTQFQEIISANDAARDLLVKNNYEPIRTSFWLEIELDKKPSEPQWPDGVCLRTFDYADLRQLVKAADDAFRDHWGYVEHDLDEDIKVWEHMIENDPKHDPSLWFLVMADEEIVGICLGKSEMPDDPDMGWLDSLAVVKEWRRRGIATALLQHSFCEFYRRGKKRVGLGADAQNLTGAVQLYKQAGMQVAHQYTIYEKVLRPGKDMVKRG